MRFANPARPGEELIVLGEMVANRRNRIFDAKGEVRNHQNLLLASATGKYLPLKESEALKMARDFVGDTKDWF